jgi:hypothetical protein
MLTLTIFSAPKPFTNPHIATIQRNAIRSWTQLGPEVAVVLIGQDEGLAEAAAELGVMHLPEVQCNSLGTPLVSSMFEMARQSYPSRLLACINADILVMPDFLAAAQQVASRTADFLMVGQRWDLDVPEELDFSSDPRSTEGDPRSTEGAWETRLRQRMRASGSLHPRGGSDYFIFPRQCFVKMPEFAIGRAGWDNWMIYEARQQGWPTLDATGAIDIVHQAHDYSHLPNGQPHYRLPETTENTRLAGGKRHIFHLIDCDRRIVDGKIGPYPSSWEKLWREVEIFPLVKLHSEWLGQAFFAFFHPLRAYREFRTWMKKK